MKRQIERLTPHQNGKVLGILTAVGTLPMFALAMLPMMFMMPKVDPVGNPIDFPFGVFPFAMFLFMPVIYMVFTYLSVAFGCWLYNKFFRFIGGFEVEFKENEEGCRIADKTHCPPLKL